MVPLTWCLAGVVCLLRAVESVAIEHAAELHRQLAELKERLRPGSRASFGEDLLHAITQGSGPAGPLEDDGAVRPALREPWLCSEPSAQEAMWTPLSRSLLLEILHRLHRCGFSGPWQEWPLDQELEPLTNKAAVALQALAAIRSDNASLICPEALRAAVEFALEKEVAAPALDLDELEIGGDSVETLKGTQPEPQPLLRCPRCGYAVAADKATQEQLLAEAAALHFHGTAQGQAPEDAYAGSPDVVCKAAAESAQARLLANWAQGGAAALVHVADLLGCGRCEREGLRHALAAAPGTAAAFLAAALLQCLGTAAEEAKENLPELLSLVRIVEEAAWDKTSSRLLHEVASRGILALHRAGLWAQLAALGLSAPLCGQGGPAMGLPKPLGSREADPVRIAAAYLDLVHTGDPLMASYSLVLAAHWLSAHMGKVGPGARHTLRALIQTARQVAVSLLAPGQQFVVLHAALGALRGEEKTLAFMLRSRLQTLGRLTPLWSPPLVALEEVRELARRATWIQQSFTAQLLRLGPQDVPDDPRVGDDVQLHLYEASLAGAQWSTASLYRPFALGAALRSAHGPNWLSFRAGLDDVLGGHRYASRVSSLPPASPQESFARIRGVRVHRASGHLELILQGPLVGDLSGSALSAEAAVKLLELEVDEARVELLAEESAELPWLTKSPLRWAALSFAQEGGDASGRLLRAALALQQVASGEGLALIPPYPVAGPNASRTAGDGRSLKTLRPMVGTSAAAPGEHFRSHVSQHARLRASCTHVPYRLSSGPSSSLTELWFGTPRLDVRAEGVPAQDSLARLAAELTARLTTHETSDVDVEMDSLAQVCLFRAAGRLLAAPKELWQAPRDLGMALQPASHKTGSGVAGFLPPARPRHKYWLQQLGNLLQHLLERHLGLQDLDPGNCWDGQRFSFPKCCAVGDYAAECWQKGFAEERCCKSLRALPEIRKEDMLHAALQVINSWHCGDLSKTSTQLLTDWLLRPTGLGAKKTTLSGTLADSLEEDFGSCRGKAEEVVESPPLSTKLSLGRWVPGPTGGAVPTCAVEVNPELQESGDVDGAVLGEDGVVALTLNELRRRGQQPALAKELRQLAGADPRVRTLRRLQSTLRRVVDRVDAAKPEKEGNKASGSQQTCDSWKVVSNEDYVAPGMRLRLHMQDGLQEEFEVQGSLEDTGKAVHVLKQLKTGWVTLHNLTAAGTHVELLVTTTDQEKCSSQEELTQQAWPDCIQRGQMLRGIDSAGVFANLASLGIVDGCFQGDCGHSDHFSCGSPALCARICSSIRACGWWSFQPTNSGGTCWLRRHDKHRVVLQEGLLGERICQPPVEARMPVKEATEPTLFTLAGGLWGLGPTHPAGQWDLLHILEQFGSLTASELAAQEPSSTQRSAMRFTRRAQAVGVWAW